MKTIYCFLITLACFHLPFYLLMSLGINLFLSWATTTHQIQLFPHSNNSQTQALHTQTHTHNLSVAFLCLFLYVNFLLMFCFWFVVLQEKVFWICIHTIPNYIQHYKQFKHPSLVRNFAQNTHVIHCKINLGLEKLYNVAKYIIELHAAW